MTNPPWVARRCQCVGATLSALLCLPPAEAALWALESQVQTSVESNDNLALAPTSPASTQRLTVQGSGSAARQTENSATRVDASTKLLLAGTTTNTELPFAEGRVALNHNLTTERDTYAVLLEGALEDDLSQLLTATDIYLGQSRRTTRAASADWSHRFSERLSAQTGLRRSRTDFSENNPAEVDYSNRSFSAGLSYRWDELLRVGASLESSRFEQLPSGDTTTSDSVRITAARPLNERSNLSASVGRYRTATLGNVLSLVCPLQQALCDAGLVVPVIVSSEVERRAYGTQYDVAWDWSVSETSSLRVEAASNLSPSGAGVVREDEFNASLSRALSPTWNATASLGQSRTRSPSNGEGPEPRLDTLQLTSTWALGERLSLVAVATHRRYSEALAGIRAESNAIALTLQYQGPKRFASR